MTQALLRYFTKDCNPRQVCPDVVVQVRGDARAHTFYRDEVPHSVSIESVDT
jgi:hypothetical protein